MTDLVRKPVIIGAILLNCSIFFTGYNGMAAENGLSDEEIDRRLAFLVERLDDSKTHGQAWHYGWTAAMLSSVIGNSVRFKTNDKESDHYQAGVEMGRATLGLFDQLWFRPLETRYGADHIRVMPHAVREQRLQQLRAAEAQLERNAMRAYERSNWLVHAGTFLVNAIGAGIVAFGDDWESAAVMFGTGILGGELRIWTAPRQPSADWDDYKRFKDTGIDEVQGGFYVLPTLNGFALHWTF